MQQLAREIRLGWADPVLNGLLASLDAASRPFAWRFNQFGDPFLMLDEPYAVPSLPIHHDVRRPEPSPAHLAAIRDAVGGIARAAPHVLGGLTWTFDSRNVMRPAFHRVRRDGDRAWLYLLRLDLAMRPGEGQALGRGTPDARPPWNSRKLYVEPTIVPLAAPPALGDDGRDLAVAQTISDTFLGEVADPAGAYGPYNWMGVWMDPRLSRFFSWLLLPDGPAVYPYHPFQCRFGTVCAMPLDLTPAGFAAAVPLLQDALGFLAPAMGRIEEALRRSEFSPKLPVFQELKRAVPDAWYAPWRGLRVEAYLNENDRKEYRLDG